MIKVYEEDYFKLSKLCSNRKGDMILLWFLEGNPGCAAWVDDIDDPKEAGKYREFFLANV